MKEWIKGLLEDQKVVEFIRYCIVGGCAVVIHYGIYLLLNQWLAVNLAYTIGYVLSVCFHWWMTFRFSFREEITVRRTGGYLLCNGMNYVLNMLFLNSCRLICLFHAFYQYIFFYPDSNFLEFLLLPVWLCLGLRVDFLISC